MGVNTLFGQVIGLFTPVARGADDLVMAVREALTRRRHLPHRMRTILKRVGVALGLLAAVGLLATVALVAMGMWQLHHASPLRGLSVPKRLVVCQSRLTQRCPSKAARRVGFPVAWVPVPTGYRLLEFVATPQKVPSSHRTAWESLRSQAIVVELNSQPQGFAPSYNTNLIGRYVVDRTKVLAYIDEPWVAPQGYRGLTFWWRHRGVEYELSAHPYYLLDRVDPAPRRYLDLIGAVRYANPPTRAVSSP